MRDCPITANERWTGNAGICVVTTDIKTDSFGVFESFPFHDHSGDAKVRLLYQSIYQPLVLPSVTRKYCSKAFELFDLLQCIAAYLQRALTWFSGERDMIPRSFVLIFSHATAADQVPVHRTQATQKRPQKSAVDSAASNSETPSFWVLLTIKFDCQKSKNNKRARLRWCWFQVWGWW